MGTEKRARQKAGTQARREAAKEAAARAKKRRTIIRVVAVVAIVVAVFLSITLSGGDDDSETVAPPPPPVGAEVTAEPTGEEMTDAGDDGGETGGTDAAGGEPSDDPAAAEPSDDDGAEGEPADEADPEDGSADGSSGGDEPEPQPTATGGPAYTPYAAEEYGSGPCAPAGGAAEVVLDFGEAPALCIDTSVPHTAVFDTSRGTVRVALDVANTPGTVNSFVNLARFGYYDGTLVHRSAPSIGILQGGSPHTNTAADPGPGYTLWDEGTGFTYRPGQLVMARRGEPNSAGAQYFFTVTPDAGLLDGQGTYVVFGEVTSGLEVLTAILDSHVDQPDNPLGGAPDPPVVVNSLTIETD